LQRYPDMWLPYLSILEPEPLLELIAKRGGAV
jgi:hypothetical protein